MANGLFVGFNGRKHACTQDQYIFVMQTITKTNLLVAMLLPPALIVTALYLFELPQRSANEDRAQLVDRSLAGIRHAFLLPRTQPALTLRHQKYKISDLAVIAGAVIRSILTQLQAATVITSHINFVEWMNSDAEQITDWHVAKIEGYHHAA